MPIKQIRVFAAAGLILCSLSAGATASDVGGSGRDPSSRATELVAEAWRAIDEGYFDASFGGADWQRVGEEYRGSEFASTDEAHAAIRRMLSRLGNPSTRFLTPAQGKAMFAELGGDLGSGVGLMELLSIDVDEADGGIVIVTPVAQTPAAQAGLGTGDRILAIDGVSAAELDLASVMSALRGPEGSLVEVTVRRGDETRAVPVTREMLGPVDPVVARILAIGDIRVAYLGLTLFTAAASDEVLEEIVRMRAEGADAFVLDLRNNPGGLLRALQTIAGAFLGEAPLARISERGGERTLTSEGEQLTGKPLVVLINEGTASAAEVLASALRHNRRARLVGTRSFGKGLAHGYTALADGSGVMYTIGRIKTLAGDDILTAGVAPDLAVEFGLHPVVAPDVEAAGPDDLQFAMAIGEVKRLSALD